MLLANFDGTWPGLVGMLCLAGTLTSLGKNYSRLWSENFDDTFFIDGLATWLKYGYVNHQLSYLKEVAPTHRVMATEAGEVGRKVGEYIIKNKEIIGLFDLDVLIPPAKNNWGVTESASSSEPSAARQAFRKKLREGQLDDKEIEIELAACPPSPCPTTPPANSANG